MNLIREWYGETLPKVFKHEKLIEFCFRSNQFLRIVNKSHTSKIKLVRGDKHALPFTDGKDCYLPVQMFMDKFYEQLGINTVQEKNRSLRNIGKWFSIA